MFIEKTAAAIIIGFCLGGIVNVAVDVAIPDAPPPIPEQTFIVVERKLAHTTEAKPMKFTTRFIHAPRVV